MCVCMRVHTGVGGGGSQRLLINLGEEEGALPSRTALGAVLLKCVEGTWICLHFTCFSCNFTSYARYYP